MNIKKIISFDPDSKEADILFTDGTNELMVYCHPITNIQNITNEILYGFMCSNIELTNSNEKIIKLGNYYQYEITAKITSLLDRIVKIGDINIKIDIPLPKDLKIGNIVKFTVDRIDLK